VLEKLDSKLQSPGTVNLSRDQGISNRTKCKAGCIDQNIGSRTRFKVYVMCNESMHVNLFPLFDAIDFQIQSNINEVASQLGVSECKVHQSTLME
jgi:hypothetical protein